MNSPASSQSHPLNGQNLLNMRKNFCQFSLKCLLHFFFKNFLTKWCKAFFKCSNYRFSGLLLRTYVKNSYFDTSISHCLQIKFSKISCIGFTCLTFIISIFKHQSEKQLASTSHGLITELSRNEKLQKCRIILSQHTSYLHRWLVLF